jgi:hypothetical protein
MDNSEHQNLVNAKYEARQFKRKEMQRIAKEIKAKRKADAAAFKFDSDGK